MAGRLLAADSTGLPGALLRYTGTMQEYKGPDDFYGPNGIIKQLSKALIERMMEAELTEQIGYEKSEFGEKQTGNRRNNTGKTNNFEPIIRKSFPGKTTPAIHEKGPFLRIMVT